MKPGYVALIAIVAFNFGVMIGRGLGVHWASERFYDECLGGEIIYTSSSGTATAVGCAEIARHVR